MLCLQFVRGTDFEAQAIEWFGGGPRFSHVDLVMPDGQLLGARSDVIGGAPPGVQLRDHRYVGHDQTLRVEIPCTDEQAAKAIAFAKEQIGKPYDKMAIFAFIIGRNWREDDAWFCSELCTMILETAGIIHPLAATANKISPAALVLVLSALVPIKI